MSGHSDREHTLLSASRLPRVARCVGSVALEEQFPNSENRYSAEGTAGHEVAAVCIANGSDAHDYVGHTYKVGSYEIEIEETFAEELQIYIDYIRKAVDAGAILYKLEQRVDFSQDIGVEGQSGSADAILIWVDQRLLEVPDLKCGYTPVEAEGNEQGRAYALGALREIEAFFDIERVKVTIAQIRDQFRHEELTVEELRAWAHDEMSPIAQKAKWIYDQHQTGELTVEAIDLNGFLVPGEKQCQFCRAAERAACPALDREALTDVSQAQSLTEFEDFTKEPSMAKALSARLPLIADLPDDELAKRFTIAPLVETWLSGIRAETERRMLEGKKIPDPAGGELKLIRGRKGNRKWKDAEEAEQVMKAARLKVDEMYTKKVISPTVAEKVLKDKPKVWAKLSDRIEQSEGKLSVARASAKGEAVSLVPQFTDFEALPPEEDLSSLA